MQAEPENTSLKCMSLSTILSGCRLQSPWPWPGRYLWAKSFKNKELSLCRDLPTDRGLWRPPTERAARSFEANWKLQMQASKKGKLEGKKEDVAALSLPILFFLVGSPPPPQFGLENVRVQFVCDGEHLPLNLRESGATPPCFSLMKIWENYPKITSANNHPNGWYYQTQSSVWRLKRQNTRHGGKCDAIYMGLFPW